MTSLAKEIKTAAKQAPRIYFAPLVGAIRAVRNEFNRVSRANMAKSNIRSK